ncbi:MAG: hypothetical protein S4CHLAM2_02530 [Chlamydiales bacterium]|nr:hypothetical protein [Chlamydiales bacterium]
MHPRFFDPPKTMSYFLFGPRGTGKSTWLRKTYPKAFWIDLLDPESFRFFSAGPERVRGVLDSHPEQKIVVIDEIQRVPSLLDVVHSLIEEKKGYQFILTGSIARKLRQQGVNLLGGRALLRYMSPFFAKEMESSFDLSTNLKLGMLPIVLDSPSPEEVLSAYVGIYLKEEVQAEGIVRNVGDFARFLEAMSFSHASLINTSNIARECEISRKTVDGYLHILNDLLLSFQLTVFNLKAKRSLVKHAKFYFFDSGVYYSLRPKNLHDVETEREGAALEGLVAQHLKAWADAQKESHSLHFWQTQSKIEVDFILYGPECFVALEVKNGTKVQAQDLKGLKKFQEDYPQAKTILLYRGKRRYEEEGVLCCPVDSFLMKIDPSAPIPE